MKPIRILAIFGLSLAIAACGKPSPAAHVADASGWYSNLAPTLADARPGPRLIVVTRAGWSAYERTVYDDPALADLLGKVPHARIDMSMDTPQLVAWGLQGAPALVLVNAKGQLLTSLVGARDISFVRRTIERTLAFPLTRTELSSRTDTPAQLRLIEVEIDQGDMESAAVRAGRFIGPDTSTDAALGQYLYAYSNAELQKSEEARTWATRYLERYPTGADRTAVQWILAVLDLQADKGPAAEARIRVMVAADSGSFYARQAVLAYAMEYLARQKQKLGPAEKFLSGFIAESGPWTDDFQMAHSSICMSAPNGLALALEDLKSVIRRNGRMAEEAEERLIMTAASPGGGEQVAAPTILFLQDVIRLPGDRERSRFSLTRLYLISQNIDRGREEALKLAAGDGAYADDAMLLLGALALEHDLSPDSAVIQFQSLIKRFPDRETIWPAKYGLARALFFSGKLQEAATAMDEVLGWLAGRRFLPDAFQLITGPQTPASNVMAQIEEYRKKTRELLAEENGTVVFQKLLTGVLASSHGDTAAATAAFKQVVEQHPASSVADDAYMELAKIALRERRMADAQTNLTRITTSYKASDQYEPAVRILSALSNTGR